ncbi:MAG TPA: endo alpha-1,4 polygalactosaminidase [Baekduia sp.]|uniref:endo alpha-1,4 polygalactosaminidase n=1 Tax=Baekduia sp. TaxID=2600305 RepID=UPI002C3905E8|nr:endo alpha-1,4 polygalactosaminidase [Baekduia sp.]HMJ36348.1 endo alpha-1,4 polygalactosaminidase [Baekduia sp.]
MRITTALRAVLTIAVLTACAAATPASGAVTLPPAGAQFDYQIGGAYTPDPTVGIVDRDRTAAPAAGKYNVCYVNAFQTQPDAARWWRSRHRSLLLRRNGKYVVDSAWNEMLLDASTAAKRRALAAVVGRWIDRCATAGYQAVEPDNLDSWTRSKHRLTMADNKAFASLLVRRAHARGLAIAQKNAPELGGAGKALGFDFAIAEECNVYDECGSYTGPFGDQVYEIEYTDNGGEANFHSACSSRGSSISIIYRDRDVVSKGDDNYTYDAC